MPFDPNQHMMNLKGKQYLPVAARTAWLREEHPDAQMFTKLEEHDRGVYALFFASISLAGGGSASGWGSETSKDFGDYLEKAETKAIGRALAALGYGTLHALEFDEGGSVADAPVERKTTTGDAKSSAAASAPIPPLPAANLARLTPTPEPTDLATHGVMYEMAKGREQPPRQEPAKAPTPEPDLELVQAKAKLDEARRVRGLGWAEVQQLAARAWPHIQSVQELGLLSVFQVQRLTEVLAGESVIDAHGKIVPAPKGDADLPLGVVGEIAGAMR